MESVGVSVSGNPSHVTEQYQKLIKSKLHIISHKRFLSSFNVN